MNKLHNFTDGHRLQLAMHETVFNVWINEFAHTIRKLVITATVSPERIQLDRCTVDVRVLFPGTTS